jgi:Big-like domain-containing protein
MRYRLAGLLVAMTLAQIGCGDSKTPGAPTPGLPAETVAVQIAPPPGDAGVVGRSTPLSATVLVNGVAQTGQSGVVWSSSNTAVARVDERGVLTGVAQGQTVITAATRNGTGTLTLEVVPALPGTMTIVWLSQDCTQPSAYCVSGVPKPQSAQLTVTQVGGEIGADWGRVNYMTGYPPFSGRIHADGSMDLSGSRCSLDDIGRGNLYALTNFRMQRRGDGIYEGSVRHVQEGSCNGSSSYRGVTDYIVALWP